MLKVDPALKKRYIELIEVSNTRLLTIEETIELVKYLRSNREVAFSLAKVTPPTKKELKEKANKLLSKADLTNEEENFLRTYLETYIPKKLSIDNLHIYAERKGNLNKIELLDYELTLKGYEGKRQTNKAWVTLQAKESLNEVEELDLHYMETIINHVI